MLIVYEAHVSYHSYPIDALSLSLLYPTVVYCIFDCKVPGAGNKISGKFVKELVYSVHN